MTFEMRRFNEEANATEVAIAIGEVFEICLSENPTAGFKWNFESRGEPVCVLVDEHFCCEREAPGSHGIHHWNFRAVAPGNSTIALTYRRQWQTAPPARIFTLVVRAGDKETRDD